MIEEFDVNEGITQPKITEDVNRIVEGLLVNYDKFKYREFYKKGNYYNSEDRELSRKVIEGHTHGVLAGSFEKYKSFAMYTLRQYIPVANLVIYVGIGFEVAGLVVVERNTERPVKISNHCLKGWLTTIISHQSDEYLQMLKEDLL